MNPVEYLRARLKRHALANYYPNNPGELHMAARNKLQECSEAPFDLHRLLDAGYPVVMS